VRPVVPFWAEDPKVGHRLALARVETVATAPAFRYAIRRHLVVDGFYEWKREGAKTKSQPFFARRADSAPEEPEQQRLF
jgi:putative SOS response-associated peptidase YedK